MQASNRHLYESTNKGRPVQYHSFKSILKIMRYLIVFSFVFFLLPKIPLQAQAAQDLVYLSNKQAHRGIVIEQKPGEYIRLLRLPESDTLQFSMEEIDRIVKILPSTNAVDAKNTDVSPEPEKRYNQNKYMAMLHFYAGGGKYALSGLGMGIGRSFNDRWHAGLGLSYIAQTSSNTFPNQQIVPLTADFKFKISESPSGRLATLFALSTGYCFSLDNRQFDSGLNTNIRITDGVFFNPSIAFRLNILRNAGIMFDLGYQFSSGNIYNVETGALMDKRTWHNFAARGSLFF